MCDYHEGELLVEGLSIRQIKWEVCALRVWWSLRDGGPTEWKAQAWWWWKVFIQKQVGHLRDLPVQQTGLVHEVEEAKGLSSVGVRIELEEKQLRDGLSSEDKRPFTCNMLHSQRTEGFNKLEYTQD